MRSSDTYGFSAVAILAIAAVAVGGGAIAWSVSSSSETSQNSQPSPTTTEATSSTGSNAAATTTFACDQGQTAKLAFTANEETQLTLPGGEVVSVTRTQSNGQTQFENTEKSIQLRNESEGGVIEQNGEVVAEGCIQAGSPGANRQPTTSPAVEVETESEMDAGVEMNEDTESEIETQMQATGTADATATQPVAPTTETDARLNTEVQTEN
jgi:hypothetical protein